MAGPDGALYAASNGGGSYDNGGTVYELEPPSFSGGAWGETVLYSFTGLGEPGSDGGFPTALFRGPAGSLYVTTSNGGAASNGSVFELTPPALPGGAWTGTVLYSFGLGPTGDTTSSAVAGPGGVIYGTNELGDSLDAGTVFELFPPATPGGAWTEATLYSFQALADGASPNDVILGPGGSLYGTTEGTTTAGNTGTGTVFQLTPPSEPGGNWTKTILKSFGGGYNCGPDSPLIPHNGDLYGAACQPGGGVVFKLTPPSAPGGAWTATDLHTFTNGQVPGGQMVMTKEGTIYGATIDLAGGTGTIYEIVP